MGPGHIIQTATVYSAQVDEKTAYCEEILRQVREYKEKSSEKVKELRQQRAQLKMAMAEQSAKLTRERDEVAARLQRYIGLFVFVCSCLFTELLATVATNL